MMKIICLNAWGGAVHGPLLDYLAAAQPDVLCLQEVIRCEAPKAELTYRDEDRELPQRTGLYREVTEALGDHTAFFAPAATGPLWDGETAYDSQWGVATWVRRSLPLIGMVQGFVHRDYSHDGFGDHPRSRTAQGVRVYDESLQRPVNILHMHGLRDAQGKIDTPERATQARRFLAMLDAMRSAGDLNVLCGDFNVEPDSATLHYLGEAGFTELVTATGAPTTRSSLYKKPGKWADYMLTDDPRAVRNFEVVHDPVVSDHCPLTLTL